MTLPSDDQSMGDTENAKNDQSAADQAPEASKDDAGKKSAAADSSKALATAGASPVNPFLAAASETEDKIEMPVPPRSLASRMLDYSAHAAIIVGLIGFAWTVSDHVVNRPNGGKTETQSLATAAVPVQPQKLDEMAQLRQSNLKMHEEIRALKASIDTLRTATRRDTTPEQVRMLSAGLDTVKSNLGAMRSETNSAISQLSGKVDKLQPGKVRDLTDRLARLEHQATDQTATGSIGKAEPKRADLGRNEAEKAPTPKPPAKPTNLAKLQDTRDDARDAKADDKPQTITGMYVRDVYRGVALIEGRRGTMEVVPGMNIPGAGVVKTIERHDGKWTVVTSKGEIASAASTPPAQPQAQAHPYRPMQQQYGYGRGYAPYYRYGY